MAAAIAALVTLDYPTPVKRATWNESVTIGAETWSAGVLSVGELEIKSGVPDRRLSIALDAESNADRAVFLTDPGPVAVTVEWATRADGASAWIKIPGIKYVGRYSSSQITDTEISITCETLRGTIFAGQTPTMTDAYQRERYKTPKPDRGFEYAEKLSVEGILLKPPGAAA